jgi:nitrite reductase/ring-hydroxylating ferredoxin subunit
MPDQPSTLDRRSFCACALAATALACGGGGGGATATGPTLPPAGPKTTTDTKAALLATANGTVRDYRNLGAFWLIHDATGIYAMTAVCTHQGCIIGQGGPAFACPCHGSEYNLGGTVTQGPATQALRHYAVSEPTPGAALVVDTSQVVAADVRLT